MSETENLMGREAVEKLRELVKAAPNCMFGSRLTVIPIHVCPMQAQQVDDSGNLWFFSGRESEHNAHIEADARVQLIFANGSGYEFLTIYGPAEVTEDPAKVDELWNSSLKAWFPEGKEDPSLTLIRVRPDLVHYWETKDGKILTLAKIAGAAITGKGIDPGKEGDLTV